MTQGPLAVLMSTFNEERDVDRSLDALLAQTVPAEIIVVDGGSTDGTVPRLRARASAETRVKVHADGVRRSLPDALNLALTLTQAPLVAKADARTFMSRDFLERALAVFEREGDALACAGGRPDQFGETEFGQAVARARMSPFGVGASGYADARAYADVDTVQCGVYRRSALLEVGGFDPALQYGEDEELNWRLRRAGYRIVRDTNIRFRYVTRPSWSAAFRQYRNYGRARVGVWEKHPEFVRVHHLVPSLAVMCVAGLSLAAPLSQSARRLALLAAGAYAAGALVAGAAASRDGARGTAYTAAAFSALHLGYGVGLLEGLWQRGPALREKMFRRLSH